jgi:hypothetical protein
MPHGLRTSVLVLLAAGVLGWAVPRRFFSHIAAAVRTISRRPRIVFALIWMVALIPMVLHTVRVRHLSVNVPLFDDWAMAPLIVKAHIGQLRFANIFQQQQEARTILPNLIFILTAQSEWNTRDQMALSLIACWLTAGGFFVLLRRAGLSLIALAICFWLMVLTLFSPAPFELWLFASGFPSFLPLLFLVLALVAIGTKISTRSKFAICFLLAVASTFTLAHGLLAWGLTFPLLLVVERIRRWKSWLAAWATAAAICAAIYFWGFEKQGDLPRFAPAISPVEYISFVVQFLGSGLAYGLNHQFGIAATTFGLLQLSLLAVAACYFARRFRDRAILATILPWLALALHAIASACLAALGRVGFGADYARSSRYVPFSLALTIAVIALTALVLRDLARRGFSRRWIAAVAVLCVVGYLVPYKVATGNTLFHLRGYSASDRLAKGAIVFSHAIDTSSVIKTKVFPPRPDHVMRNAAALDDLKLLRPPLVRSNRLNALPHEAADGNRVAGLCETITKNGDLYSASGWAVLKAKGRAADCVLVGYELPGADPLIIAISGSSELRWEIARTTGSTSDYLWAGWTATFPRTAIPENATLTFWAVDADEPRLYRLERKGP